MKTIYFLLAFITFSANAQQSEAINWDDARINDKLELTIPKRDFEKLYKKADSIITPNYNDICGTDDSSNFQYYHYKGVKYELDNGIMNFRQITFRKKGTMFFTYKGQKFDANTRIDDLKALFPNVIKEIDLSKKEIYKYLLLDSADKSDDSEWRFTFKNGYLESIECFFPC